VGGMLTVDDNDHEEHHHHCCKCLLAGWMGELLAQMSPHQTCQDQCQKLKTSTRTPHPHPAPHSICEWLPPAPAAPASQTVSNSYHCSRGFSLRGGGNARWGYIQFPAPTQPLILSLDMYSYCPIPNPLSPIVSLYHSPTAPASEKTHNCRLL
jgi:hypothetical protein